MRYVLAPDVAAKRIQAMGMTDEFRTLIASLRNRARAKVIQHSVSSVEGDPIGTFAAGRLESIELKEAATLLIAADAIEREVVGDQFITGLLL